MHFLRIIYILAKFKKILFNLDMEKEIDEKVVDIFKRHNSSENKVKDKNLKYFAGFNYVKLSKDVNGNPFVKQNLLEYAQTCRYIVRVMRELNNQVFLYNYDVNSDELFDFLKKFKENELNGQIIEIEKYITEDLA